MDKNLTVEQTFTELAASEAINPETVTRPDQPVIMLKRIGSTTYQVAVHFSDTSKETMNDKITRLIKNDLNIQPIGATMELSQTGRLPERGSA